MKKSAVLCGVVIGCVPMAGIAQSAPAAGKGAEPAAEPATERIEVTAQRRAERPVDVPISVVSIGQEELEKKRIDSIFDLGKSVTSLRFEGQAPSFQPTLRGVGTLVQGGGVDASVAVYVDGVYLPNTFGMNFDLPNVKSVQVLKGPQGTLFGRNATGGAILITTQEPNFESTARLKASYSRFNDLRLNGYVSRPLNEDIAAGISVNYRTSPGYSKNLATGSDDDTRVKMFNLRPDIRFSSGDLSLRLIYEHNYAFDTSALGLVNVDGYSVASSLGARVGRKFGEFYSDGKPINRNESDSATAIAEWDLGGKRSLKSVTNYRTDSNLFVSDGDVSALPLLEVTSLSKFKTFSQEFTLSGKSTRLDWVAGAYYFNSNASEPGTIVKQGGVSTVIKSSRIKTDAAAAFADATWQAADAVFVTGGLRYSTERKNLSLLPFGQPPELKDQREWSGLSPRAVVRYQLARSDNVYASFSKGFKSGAFAGFPPNLVEPERVKAYEAGFKHSSPLFDLNAALFLYDYRDFQVTTFDFTTNQGKTVNAAKQRNAGLEVDMAFRPTAAWRINLAAAYLDAKFKSFANATKQVQASVPIAPGVSVPGAWISVPQDASNTVTPRSPKWSGNASTSYDFALGAGKLQLSANVAMSSGFYNMMNEQFREPGYAELGMNASYMPADGSWRGDVFVTNLTNHLRRQQYQGGPVGTYAIFLPPRVVGASISYSFK